MFDLVLKGGTIITGLNNERFIGDIGIKNQKITKISNCIKSDAATLDVKGLIVAPGFIDMHTHSDVSFIEDELCESKLYQGVTTELVGCCGFSYYPSTEDGFDRLKSYLSDEPMNSYASGSLKSFVAKTKELYKTINWATYIGHGALRVSVVGYDDVLASAVQLEEMKVLLDRELTSGAFGLSLGVAYAPGMFADSHEYIELAKIVKKHNKIVTSHIRNENDHVFEAVEELIEIGRQSKAHVHISHMKLGYGNWYKAKALLELIDAARFEGINITFEQYPYEASATGLSAVLPNWVHDGGIEKMLNRFATIRDDVIKGIESSNSFKMGLDRVLVVSTNGFLPEVDGKNIRDISEMLEKSEAETVIYLLEHTNCSVPTIRFTMEEQDILEIMKREDCAVISDGSALSLEYQKVMGMPHPRNYGTFPRFLKLNRSLNLMSLENAIQKMTSLPAKYIGLKDRGSLVVGQYADITVFDEKTIEDVATFQNSIRKSKGIKYVIVNGKVVISSGRLTNERPGEILLNTQ